MVGARRQPISPLWQWNRIYQGGPFRPKDIPFTGEEKYISPMLRNPTSQDFFQYSPRFEGPRRPPSGNLVRFTGQNHWPAKRYSPENWKGMQ